MPEKKKKEKKDAKARHRDLKAWKDAKSRRLQLRKG